MKASRYILPILLCLLAVGLYTCDNVRVYTLETNVTPSTGGTVTPSGGEFEEGETVELRANPSGSYLFSRWEGDFTGTENPRSFEMEADVSVTAVFELKQYSLNVEVQGEGTVREDVMIADSSSYEHGSRVQLTAEPAEGWEFNRWEGDIEDDSNPVTITLVENNSVRAVFDFIATPPEVSTRYVNNIESFIARVGGEVTNDGNSTVTDRGICWDTSRNPTLSDFCVSSGGGIGEFSSSLSYLDPNTTYFVRAYATNEVATSYGSALSFSTRNPSDPHSFLLSWQRNPSTTMTIDWHTDEGAEEWMQYRRKGDSQWQTVRGEVMNFPYSSRIIHRKELTGLAAGATYEFRFTGRDIYTFRTLPSSNSRPIRFVAAGDVMHTSEWMRQTAQVAAGYDPDFVVLGGDLAYANGGTKQAPRWHDYLETWSETMITSGGRVIPHLVSIGNHEVQQHYVINHPNYQQTDAYRASIAPYFYTLFAFPGQPGYDVLDFGDYMSLIFLDTHHSNPVGGEQTDWLKKTLGSRQDGRHLIPVYHVGAYPTRRQDEVPNREVRDHWVPLFDQYGVRVAFENHNHSYKRTYPLRGGVQNSAGITYMGDGSWGVAIEPPDPYSYLRQAQAIRHFIMVEVDGSQINMRAIDGSGNQFDQVTVNN